MGNAYQSYETVRRAIAGGDRPENIPDLPRFVADFKGRTNDEVMEILLGTVFDPDVLYDFLSEKFRDVLEDTAQQGKQRNGRLAWTGGFHGRAAQQAYERTGQTRFLDLYIGFYREMLALRDDHLGYFDDYHGRVMTSWGVAGETLVNNAGFGIWCNLITHYAVQMQPATGIARLIHEDPGLRAYSEFADQVVEGFTVGYRDFDIDIRHLPGTDDIWYWRPSKFLYEATNHIHLLGETLLNMHAITGEALYAERIASFIRTFEKSARIDAKGFVAWDYHPYFAQSGSVNNRRQKSELAWKASHTVPFVYAAKRQGFAVDRDILEATTRTIRDHVVADNDYAGNLHPRGSVSYAKRLKNREATDPAKALTIVGFLAASAEDPKIKDQIRTIVATRRDIFPDGWLQPAERKSYCKGPLGYAFMMAAP